MSDYIEFDYDSLEADTCEAFLFITDSNKGDKLWVPKSVVEPVDREELEHELRLAEADNGMTDAGSIEILEWFAIDKGLV